MGMAEDLKRVQESRTVGKETSTTIDPGPFADITPLETPETKDPEKEPSEVVEEVEEAKEEKEEEVQESVEEEIPADKQEAAYKKYKTPEEAAKAAYNATKRMTEATSETARLKRENEELRQRSMVSQPVAQPKPEIPVEDVIVDKYYADIARLPEDEPDREKKVVRLLAKMNGEISEAKRIESDSKAEERDNYISVVESRAKELGLTENDLDDFWTFAKAAPKHLAADEAVKWTVGIVSKLNGNNETVIAEAKKKVVESVRTNEAEKKRMAPLGKGSMKTSEKQAESKPILSLSDALREMRKNRVYK